MSGIDFVYGTFLWITGACFVNMYSVCPPVMWENPLYNSNPFLIRLSSRSYYTGQLGFTYYLMLLNFSLNEDAILECLKFDYTNMKFLLHISWVNWS